MNELERIREQALLTDEEMELCYQKEYKKALAFSEKYDTSLSLKNFNPNRPADRQRSFDVTHREQVMKAIAQAQLDKALKAKGIRIESDDQSLPENPFEQGIEKEGLPEDGASRERLLNNSALYKQAQEQIVNLGWIKCQRRNNE